MKTWKSDPCNEARLGGFWGWIIAAFLAPSCFPNARNPAISRQISPTRALSRFLSGRRVHGASRSVDAGLGPDAHFVPDYRCFLLFIAFRSGPQSVSPTELGALPPLGILRSFGFGSLVIAPSPSPGYYQAMPKTPELSLKEGDTAPSFAAETQSGKTVSLPDLKGKPVVLYFYPKDDTPGCTKEACAFRDAYADFRKAGAVVLGVSTDTAKSHLKFAEKFSLPFDLLADPDKKIVQDYGVWGQKSFMGRKYMGTHRVTFLIGPDGRIAKIWPTVKPEEHASEVLTAVRETKSALK